jgi:hypothetical protein
MPVARVVLEPTIDNEDAPLIMLDVPIDEAGNPVGKRLLFGLQGDPPSKGEHYYPFTMTRSGEIDFGRGFDEEPNDRYAQLDLLDGAIKEGRLVHLRSENYGDQTYRVTRLTDLVSG